ncbi:hypothetical protein FSP39_000947, partial [Pinctada imbricata]
HPPIPPNVIYVNVGAFLLSGFFLSAKVWKKEICLVYAGQQLFFAYNMYTNPSMGYTKWQRLRMSVHQAGCAAMFILLSSLHDPKQSKHLRKIAETLTGFFLIAYTYMLNNSPEDRRALLAHIPGDDWSRYVVTLILAAGAVCFFSGHFLRDISISLVVVFAILTLFVDCDIDYWVKSKHMHIWNQIRIIIDNICIIIGLSVVIMKFGNKVKME